MPDPTKETVSGTQVAPILDIESAYETRWLVYQWFRGEIDIPDEDNERMEIGRAIQPAILDLVASRYSFDVEHNEHDEYYRHPHVPVGCTPDGLVQCPTRGYGVVEVKNVDFLVWKSTWAFRDGQCVAAPKHIELQVHAEMLALQAKWGLIAALVGGNELVLLERKPDDKLQARIASEASKFLLSVKKGEEPEIWGTERELKCLTPLYRDLDTPQVLDLREGEEGLEVQEMARTWDSIRESRVICNKDYTKFKAKLLQKVGQHNVVMLPNHVLKIGRNSRLTLTKEVV